MPELIWLDHDEPFPPLERAAVDPNGLLAAGLDLTPKRVLDAYQKGIFPWFSAGQPVLWWSPNPRMVLFTAEFRLHRSLKKTLHHIAQDNRWELRCDTCFETVIRACAEPREDGGGTWIHESMIEVYCDLHRQGITHSIETWFEGQLVGGLYGLSVGRMFYGESMFTRRPDASKIALASLAHFLYRNSCPMIDCQQSTSHLASMGGREIDRKNFIAEVKRLVSQPSPTWPSGMFPLAVGSSDWPKRSDLRGSLKVNS